MDKKKELDKNYEDFVATLVDSGVNKTEEIYKIARICGIDTGGVSLAMSSDSFDKEYGIVTNGPKPVNFGYKVEDNISTVTYPNGDRIVWRYISNQG